jgi:hypothetical protein
MSQKYFGCLIAIVVARLGRPHVLHNSRSKTAFGYLSRFLLAPGRAKVVASLEEATIRLRINSCSTGDTSRLKTNRFIRQPTRIQKVKSTRIGDISAMTRDATRLFYVNSTLRALSISTSWRAFRKTARGLFSFRRLSKTFHRAGRQRNLMKY